MQQTTSLVKQRISLIAFSLLLAGCNVGPDYHRQEEPAVVLSQPLDLTLSSNLRLQRDWWRQFQDPQLNRAIELALRSNQDIQIMQAKLLASRAGLDQRQLDRLPAITSSVSYAHSLSQTNPGMVGEPNPATHYAGTMNMQWELDLFGRLRRLSEVSAARSNASAADLAQTQIVVTAEVARNYFLMRGAQKKLEIARSHLANQDKTVSQVEMSVAAGRSQDDELASARAERARVQARLAPIITQYALTRFRLAVLMGLRPNDLGQIIKDPPMPMLVTRLPIGNISDLLRLRPDVASAERMLAASTADVGVATAELYPRIDLGGFIGLVAIRGGDISSSTSRAFGIMPSIDWPALHYASVKARQREAQARQKGSEAHYKQVVLQAIEETEGALMRYSQSQQRLQVLAEAVAQSRHAAMLANVRYQAGRAPFLNTLAAQRNQLEAEDTLAEADTETFINVVMVYKALGGGWSTTGGDTGGA